MSRKRLLNGSQKYNAPFSSVERQLVEMTKKSFMFSWNVMESDYELVKIYIWNIHIMYQQVCSFLDQLKIDYCPLFIVILVLNRLKPSFLIEFVTSKNNALFFVHFLDELLLQFKTFSTKQYDFARTSSIPYCFPWWLLWRWQHESKVLFYTNLYSLMHILLLHRFLHFSLLPLQTK